MVQFGRYLQDKQKLEWAAFYVDYKALKELIKASAEGARGHEASFSPRTTSLTVQRYDNKKDSAEERFFRKLENEVDKVNKFTSHLVDDLRGCLRSLSDKAAKETTDVGKQALLKEAQRIGDDFLALEKYVNLNYMGLHKILKKHDKMLPHAPCRQFYVAHLHQQPWVQGNYSDLLVALSGVYSRLRGDTSGQKNEDAAQGFTRSTTKYWVRNEDVSTVKHHVLQHLPVFQFDKNNFAGDAQLINSVYMDNSSCELYHGRLDKKPGAIALRVRWYGNQPPAQVFMERKTHKESWKGEESVKERFQLPEDKVVAFIDGEYPLEEALQAMTSLAASKNKTVSAEEKEAYSLIYNEVSKALDSKQLRPFIRTQYMRTAFQIPFDATVRVSLDTNLCMIKENPEDGPTCAASGRWYRDPALPVHRTEITRFPHAVLEVKLSLPEGQTAPPWVQELIESGYLTEVHKFSKFIHGTATLFPDMVRAVPYWVDDESVRSSMLASAPPPAPALAASASMPRVNKPRKTAKPSNGSHLDELSHPLLGEQPTLKLMKDRDEVSGLGTGVSAARQARGPTKPSWIMQALGLAPTAKALERGLPMKIEPKTFFANERTFLAWLHMAVTLGSIAAALLGFSSGGSSDPGMETHALSRNLVEIIALILLPLAMAMCAYALYTFSWRASNIAKKKTTHFDDRYGPLVLCSAVVVALCAIFLISCIDFYLMVQDAGQALVPEPSPENSIPLAML